MYRDFVLYGPLVADGEWWRLLTAGFLHGGLFHLLLNMYALYFLGRMLEPALGHVRFAGIFFTSLLTGSLVVMLMQPDARTLGASGAVYGLLGAAIVMARNRNIDLVQSGLLPILGLNFVVTLVFGFSLAAHVGGLLGGLWLGLLVPPGKVPTLRSAWQNPRGEPAARSPLLIAAGLFLLLGIIAAGLALGGATL